MSQILADVEFDVVVECAHFLNHLALAHHLLNSHRREFVPGPFLSRSKDVFIMQPAQRNRDVSDPVDGILRRAYSLAEVLDAVGDRIGLLAEHPAGSVESRLESVLGGEPSATRHSAATA